MAFRSFRLIRLLHSQSVNFTLTKYLNTQYLNNNIRFCSSMENPSQKADSSTLTEGKGEKVTETAKKERSGEIIKNRDDDQDACMEENEVKKVDDDPVKDTSEKKDDEANSGTQDSMKKVSFRLEEIKGDLFSCDKTDSLAHCVSADLRMGKGIAVLFKKKFMGIPELNRQKKGPGSVAVLKRESRYIYYLITKVKYNHKPTYDTLKKSLTEMQKHCVDNGVTSLSMPRIGCGLDGLVWHRVEALIKDIFKDVNIHIKVYSI